MLCNIEHTRTESRTGTVTVHNKCRSAVCGTRVPNRLSGGN